ncbi:MAG TPA: DUF4149 domain-containing protein [Candidatus Binataceae bacterium]|nr:DUF4149 domain-containing protein [Candidatus Binataceae bacterium]
MTIALFIFLLALGCWLGAMVFFPIFTATVFGNLARPEAGKVISAIFPRYYMIGYITGAISLGIAIYFSTARDARIWWGGSAVALAIALGASLYAGQILLPRVHAIRGVAEEANPDPQLKAEFDRMHQLSVRLNGAVMILNLVALASAVGALSGRG